MEDAEMLRADENSIVPEITLFQGVAERYECTFCGSALGTKARLVLFEEGWEAPSSFCGWKCLIKHCMRKTLNSDLI